MTLRKNFFEKKFIVGLTLKTNVEEYNQFLIKYSYYIDRIYFSLPLGARFHSRRHIQKEFDDTRNINLFWNLLLCIKKHNIKLELVLNTLHLTKNDIDDSFNLLKLNNINIDSVSIIDEYYKWVQPYITNQKIICSYNNGIRSIMKLKNIANNYDAYVIGNSAIRNVELHKYINEFKNSQTYLLLNNGCSFECGWCGYSNNCKEIFNENICKHTIEYLYSRQSFFPSELRSGVIDLNYIDKFKISNRTSDITYLEKCLNSYVNNEIENYIKSDKKYYSLWCRLAWFHPFYNNIDYNKVLIEKDKIFNELKGK